jgi:hypothetical protein
MTEVATKRNAITPLLALPQFLSWNAWLRRII